MSKLEGKVAVITGGNSGIGLATAQRFVAEGAYVFVTGRRQSELDAAVNQIGKSVTAVQGDVSNLADLDRLYATVKQRQGADHPQRRTCPLRSCANTVSGCRNHAELCQSIIAFGCGSKRVVAESRDLYRCNL
jgi:NAD(P)-dependent dehydrogenase (short-subunit alcohol dehydrogenase family)